MKKTKPKFTHKSPHSYFRRIGQAIKLAVVYENSGQKKLLNSKKSLETIINIFKESSAKGGKIIFIGNGGSAAIAGHMALDFSNAGKIRAISFNDGPLVTCLANDHSFDKVFEKAIEMHADEKDVLVAISSSGESKNILRGVMAANRKGCKVVTLSGFNSKNPLIRLGDLNVHVPIPRPDYGLAEVCHHTILHFLLDSISNKNPVN